MCAKQIIRIIVNQYNDIRLIGKISRFPERSVISKVVSKSTKALFNQSNHRPKRSILTILRANFCCHQDKRVLVWRQKFLQPLIHEPRQVSTQSRRMNENQNHKQIK